MSIIIYHKATSEIDCPDGIVSAAIALGGQVARGLDSYESILIHGDVYKKTEEYGETPTSDYSFITAGQHLIIVDFCYPRSWLEYWQNLGVTIELLDHHEAKFGMLKGFVGAVLDKDQCGATLSWRHWFEDLDLPPLLHHVRRRDIGLDGYYKGLARDSEAVNESFGKWRHEHPDNGYKLKFAAAIFQLLLDKNSPSLIEKWRVEGLPRLVERDRLIEVALDRVRLIEFDAHQVPYLKVTENEARHYSMIGARLALLHPACDFALIDTPDGSRHLRSTGFNVQPIAKKYGGDGHPQAAGFKL
jgi:oligoribonuclease NrnB/cAMP/cGMP phosphodiesterase (DHH superfamily)